jgi:hypothetical protein
VLVELWVTHGIRILLDLMILLTVYTNTNSSKTFHIH